MGSARLPLEHHTMATLEFLRPLVARILRDPKTEWSVQGFGMMRTYLGPPNNPKELRLNVWHSALAVPNVSTIHDHPWHFDSVILAGKFYNQRFAVIPSETTTAEPTHDFMVIKTGEGGGAIDQPIQSCILRPTRPEIMGPGNEYNQQAEEVHETRYEDGAVTLNIRRKVGDGEHARVFWPHNTDWVDAEPRAATPEEIKLVTEAALARFA
jgi:hypothetical protein